MSAKVDIARCRQYASRNNGRCLSRTYIKNNLKLLWQCVNGHKWQAPWNQIRRGHWCRMCSYEKTGEKNKHNINYCRHVASRRECHCVADTYEGIHFPLRWRCNNCGREWSASLNNVRSGNSRCPYCHHISAMENRCRIIFEALFNNPFPKCKPFKQFKSLLELDGYCKKLNIAFEYDGIHHRTGRLFPTDTRNLSIFKRDKEKDELCKNVGIRLIRISDVEATPENLVDIITKKLQNKNMPFPEPDKNLILRLRNPIDVLYTHLNKLPYLGKLKKECKRHTNPITKRTGLLLDSLWAGSGHKYNIICEMGHTFKMQYDSVITRKEWCPTCGRQRSNAANALRKIGIERCKRFAIEHNGICLSDKYINGLTKMTWCCNKHNIIWLSEAGRIVGGKTWCPKCGRDRSTAKRRAKRERNRKLLNTK